MAECTSTFHLSEKQYSKECILFWHISRPILFPGQDSREKHRAAAQRAAWRYER